MAYEVFLSHYSADLALARDIATRARVLDVGVYMYESDPRAGQPLAKKLEDRIRAADAVIVLLTADGVKRPSVHTEIGIARAMQKPLIPLVEVGVDANALVFLQGLEYVVLDPAQSESAFLHLQQSLTRLRDAARNNALLLGILLALIGASLIAYAARHGE